MFETRWYQTEAIENTCDSLVNRPGNPLIALPTGTGKSFVIADIIRRFTVSYPAMRIAMLTHSKELIKQNGATLKSVHPDVDLGFYSAGLNQKETDNQVIYGSVQSVAASMKKGENIFGKRHLTLIDEAHMIAPGANTNYQRVLDMWGEAYEGMKVCGLSATPYRMKGGLMYGAEDSMFDYVSCDITQMDQFNRLVDEGFIAPLIAVQPKTEIDLEGVKMVAGDYNQAQAAAAVGKEGVLENAVAEIVEQGWNRKSWLVFTSGVENAEIVVDLLRHHGIVAACVHSKQSDAVNDEIIADFKAGRIRAIVNANMLTTGFDFPQIDLIGMLRPTASTALWVQMLGRGTRPSYATGKENCLVLDFAGNTMRLGPINNPKIPGKVKKGGGGEAPVRICPECFTYNHASAPVCCMCGFEFPIREKLSDEASKLKLIARKDDELDEEIETFKPHHVAYTSHLKQKNGPACLLVEYQCSGLVIKNYLPWEHGGKASFIADKWWQARFDTPRPPTVDEVLRSINAGLQIPLPLGIEVNMANRYKSKIQPKLKKEIWK